MEPSHGGTPDQHFYRFKRLGESLPEPSSPPTKRIKAQGDHAEMYQGQVEHGERTPVHTGDVAAEGGRDILPQPPTFHPLKYGLFHPNFGFQTEFEFDIRKQVINPVAHSPKGSDYARRVLEEKRPHLAPMDYEKQLHNINTFERAYNTLNRPDGVLMDNYGVLLHNPNMSPAKVHDVYRNKSAMQLKSNGYEGVWNLAKQDSDATYLPSSS
ncbi:hypothetical protein CBS101457_005639 [Exobasidium rhododendri]|nr:hypothetical protein CBS101457_005639 [Exobasidium rhododendri]